MLRVSRSIEIDAPPEKVWTYIEDPAKEIQWRQPEVRHLELVGDGPLDVGSRYRGRTKIMGITDEYTNEVIEYNPPHRIAWRYVDSSGMMAGNGHYRLTPIGPAGTRFEIVLEYHPMGILGRLAQPLMSMLAGQVLQRFAVNLKRISEEGE